MLVKASRDAAEEFEEAAAWYENEQPGLGTKLLAAFEHAVQLLREPNPPLTPVPGIAGEMGGKKLVLHRFPFSLIIVEFGNTTTVVAFAHHSRMPGYWVGRLSP